jgi:Ca-activated chloride channel family protein
VAGGAVTVPADAYAAGWDDMWSRPDQQGAQAFAAGRPADAAKLFEDPAWRAAALYRAQDYAGAAESLQGQEGTEARYNLGNALARAGQLEQALAAYDEALAAQPDHEDARFNRDLVAKLLEQQKQEQQQEQNQQQQEQDPQQQQDGQQQNEQSQPQDSQSQKDQKDQADQQDQQGQSGQPEQAAQSEAEKEKVKQQAEEQQAEQEQKQPEAQQGEKGEPKDPQQAAPAPPEGPQSERELALEQWLNRIPDDPGGLLREKLRRQYAERRYGH